MSIVKEDFRGRKVFSEYEQLGFAVCCMLMNNNYSLYKIKSLQYWTLEAIRHNQFKILFDSLENPLGYITWAYLQEDTLLRFIRDPDCILHTSEWNENGTLCILDFCCKPGTASFFLKYLKKISPIVDTNKIVWLSRKSRKLFSLRKSIIVNKR